MKKLKIRSRELEKIGFNNTALISHAINSIQKHFKRTEKTVVIDLLADVLTNPKKYLSDPRLESLAKKLCAPQTEKNKFKTVQKEFQLGTDAKDYVIYGKEQIEKETLNQMDMAIRLPVTISGALMADAHSGYGLPIGAVLAAKNAIIPYGVGMDIGCRMCLSVYSLSERFIEKNRQKVKKILVDNTRFGLNEYFKEKKEHDIFDRKEFKEIKFLKNLQDKIYEQLGTSGGGNHFVEFGIVEVTQSMRITDLEPGKYIGVLSHSGSRNFGASIARHYTNIAKQKCKLPKGAINLAWLDLDSEEGTEYWQAMNLAGDYSKANHEIIHNKISFALAEKPVFKIENHHNFAWKEKLTDGTEAIVHRKGATPAAAGIYGVIPGSMTLPGFIVEGKGNVFSINSASHGAGRMLSRSKAKATFTNKSLTEALKKAGVELIGGGLDESPGAYKNIFSVMDYQKDLVTIKGIFYPKIVRMSGDYKSVRIEQLY